MTPDGRTRLKIIDEELRHSKFQQVDLSEADFLDAKLAQSTFGDVDLSESLFKDVSFRSAFFLDADFNDATILSSNLAGMRIDGVLVSELLEVYRAKLGKSGRRH